MHITVVTLTYRRPFDLSQALPQLVAHVEEMPGAELLVVDNDTEPSARATVEPWLTGHPVRYVHEPQPGIAAARNRGLDESAGSDVVVFIDDDERPAPGWLPALVETFEREQCFGVAGPVLSVFESEPDDWIRAGRFFDRLRHTTGTPLEVVATNNLLVDVRSVRAWGLRFDEAFGLTGGSDTVFSLEARRRGARFVWCDEAVVHDVVPASRATRQWVLRRAFRMGNTGSRARIHVTSTTAGRLRVRAAMGVRGAVRIVGGGAAAGTGLLTGSVRRRARGVRTAVRGAGMVSGAFGHVYAEYRRPARAGGPAADA